ncbi:MAG TPA: hypothetical protein VHD15_03835 [Hyphomicrobiales bacterium]|nr:hypothetical protein [Hyphomicrobiales bacterium]
MARIGDHAFLFAWQMIRAATQPDPEATRWSVGAVEWQRHRYSLAAPDHAAVVEVHRLDSRPAGERWSIMVVSEHWWDEKHQPLRKQLWTTHVSGSRARILEWIRQEGRAIEAKRPAGVEGRR